jgi:hypothetical protein
MMSSFLASYPGSGTRLQWELVEAITGVVTTDDTFSNGHHNVIAIKTHYPCPAGREFPGAEDVLKAIIFIRHPMDTLPAFHDIIYASENNLSQDPPPQAPLQEWITWRDLAFVRELETWRKHFVHWMDRYGSQNRLVVPYEQLTSRKYGPNLVTEMAEFLQQGNDAITTADATDLPCIWQTIMKKVQGGSGDDTSTTNKKVLVRRRLQQVTHMPQQQQLPSAGTNMQLLQINQIKNQLNGGQQMQMKQIPTMQTQMNVASLPATMQTQMNVPSLPATVQTQINVPSLPATMQTQINVPSLPATVQTQINVPILPATMQTQKNVAMQSQSSEVVEDQPSEQEIPAENLTRKQKAVVPTLAPERDAFRPYSENQRKEVVIVLTQLLELYRDDRVLAPVLVDYIDRVARAHEQEKRFAQS